MDFDPSEFGLAPNTLEATDSAQLLGLLAAREALKDAGYGPEREFDRARVSVILGVTGTLELAIPLGARLGHPIWRRALKECGIEGERAEAVVERISDEYVGWQENSFPGLLGNVVAGRIANRFNLGGTNCVVDAACASSLGAMNLAGLELASRRSKMVVTGGVDAFNDIFMFMCFSKTPALSPSGESRPFDKTADGTALGEGVGMLVLKRLDDAEKDGDRIYAVLKGVGSSSDGRGKAIYAPSAEGQTRAIRRACDMAGVTPDTIELVEAHGTGTTVGDAAEVSALSEVYREAKGVGTWCALGSVKSQIGHTKAAAGSAGIIKAAMALSSKVLPPTMKVNEPIAPVAPGVSPFYVNTEKRPWVRGAHPRRAAVSALGFGGSNFHAILEEYTPAKAGIDWSGDVQVAAFSSSTIDGLASGLTAFASVAGSSWEELRRACALTREKFSGTEQYRLVLVFEKDKTDIKALVAAAVSGIKTNTGRREWNLPEGVYFGSGTPGALAVLFPGQGSQYVGMGRDLACQFPQALDCLELADRAFPGETRLSDLIYPHPAFKAEDKSAQEVRLRDTRAAQPALGAVGLGAWRVLSDFGVKAESLAGHSYGELTALCAAGRIEPEELYRLSVLRGRLMGEGDGGRGGMLAVQAPLADIEAVLREEGLSLSWPTRTPCPGSASGPRRDPPGLRDFLQARPALRGPAGVGRLPQRPGGGRPGAFPRGLGRAGPDPGPGSGLRQQDRGGVFRRRGPVPGNFVLPIGLPCGVRGHDPRDARGRRPDLPGSGPRGAADRLGRSNPRRPGSPGVLPGFLQRQAERGRGSGSDPGPVGGLGPRRGPQALGRRAGRRAGDQEGQALGQDHGGAVSGASCRQGQAAGGCGI